MSYYSDVTRFCEHDRVKAHPATDRFMMGDVYGTVTTVGLKVVHVKMDRSNQVIRFAPENLLHIDEW